MATLPMLQDVFLLYIIYEYIQYMNILGKPAGRLGEVPACDSEGVGEFWGRP